MKRIPRNPIRFDVFGLFATHAQQQKMAIHSKEAAEHFITSLKSSVESGLASEAFIHGHHTQALFEALTVSLAATKLLKQEDAGDVYSDEDVRIPDYRAVLLDGKQLLVEVKNHYQDRPFEDPLVLKNDYMVGLQRYAALVNAPLRIAVFWARWNVWTLVAPLAFKSTAGGHELSFTDAVMNNDMALLGDKSIGTKFPLRIRFVADPTKPRKVGPDGEARVFIRDIKLFCGDNEIVNETEKNIAWYFMLYGKWESTGPAEAKVLDGELECAEEQFMPVEDNKQGFEIIGSLSSMYSAFYQQSTTDTGRIGQVRLEAEPGKLAALIPDGYKGDALPLWIFIQSPAHPL